jgi:membrane fusion protein (multidrug efflux system)
LLCGLVLALAVLAGCGEDASETNGQGRQQPSGSPVILVEAESLDFRETVRAIGSLRAPRTVQVSPEIDARIAELHFTEGQRVAKGDLLASLDPDKLRREVRSAKAALNRARAEAADAKRSYARFQELYERDTISAEERDERRTEWETAQAEAERLAEQLELMRERLDDATIRAPMDGVLSQREVDEGDFVEAGEVLVVLYSIDPLEISFTIPETYMGRVEPDMEVSVEVAAYPDCPFPGRIVFVSPSIDPQTRKFLVKSMVPNPQGQLKPGGFARVVLTLDTLPGRPAVPEQALVATREGYSLFVIEEGTATKRDVRIGLRRTGLVEIREGIEPGEAVVAQGQMRLADGAQVDVRERMSLREVVPEDGPEASPLYCPPGAEPARDGGADGS